MICFDEASHTYSHTETGEKYISVTTLLGRYKQEFDKDFHAARVAQREGVSKEFILETWSTINKASTDRGSKIHKLLENYIKVGEVIQGNEWLYKAYEKVISKTISKFQSVKTENLLYNTTFKVAGTADLIYDHGNFFTVGDFKTNKKFRFANDFYEFLKPPVDHLTHCELNDYALQLSLYAYMYELDTNKKCKKLVIYYLKDDSFVPIHCNYLKTDIKNILYDYSVVKKFK